MTFARPAVGALVCAWLVESAIAGCAAPHDLAWTIEFETPALRARATSVHAAILQGGCAGVETWGVDLAPGAHMAAAPPRLARGRWGFSATAADATCTAFASDCQVVDLPTNAVRLVLHAATESPLCSASECATGICRSDAGATADVGAADVGTDDAGTDDGGTDACPATESVCDNHTDDDCDMQVDCSDSDCASTAVCDACRGITCGMCESCSGGTCGPSGGSCTGGSCAPAGHCCTGCTASAASTCEVGNTSAACGTGGERCDVCGPCEQCMGGNCVARTDGVACAGSGGATGTCHGGSCCTVCWDAAANICRGTGSIPSQCGAGGNACIDCGECHACSAGACVPGGSAFCGSGATSGRCHNGSCCGGYDHCWNGTACVSGTTNAVCGGGGGMCAACSGSANCCMFGTDYACRSSC